MDQAAANVIGSLLQLEPLNLAVQLASSQFVSDALCSLSATYFKRTSLPRLCFLPTPVATIQATVGQA